MAKEYIEREALLERMEERLTVLRKENGNYDHYTDGFEEGCVAVEDADTADVVEVVRCKDCIISYCHSDGDFVCGRTGVNVDDDDFCSYGERRDDDAAD